MAGFPHLVVRVGEELDDEGEEVGGDDVVHRLWQLLAVHRNVRHLFHQLGAYTRLCEKKVSVPGQKTIEIGPTLKADTILGTKLNMIVCKNGNDLFSDETGGWRRGGGRVYYMSQLG